MTIYQRMEAVFAQAGVPGFLQAWRKTEEYPTIPEKYCAYLVTAESEELCADDAELIHRTDVLLSLYGKRDVSAEFAALKAALRQGGFLIAAERDLDDVRAGEYIYHRRLQAILYSEV